MIDINNLGNYWFLGTSGIRKGSTFANYSVNNFKKHLDFTNILHKKRNEPLETYEEIMKDNEYTIWQPSLNDLMNDIFQSWYLLFENELDAKLYRIVKFHTMIKKYYGWGYNSSAVYNFNMHEDECDFKIKQSEIEELKTWVIEKYPEFLISGELNSLLFNKPLVLTEDAENFFCGLVMK